VVKLKSSYFYKKYLFLDNNKIYIHVHVVLKFVILEMIQAKN